MSRLLRRPFIGIGVLGMLGLCWSPALAGLLQWAPDSRDADNPAISYSTSTPSDAVARLQAKLDAGSGKLHFDAQGGYLKSVLRELNIRVSSQGLVFSRTSAQRNLISPQRPRALYFGRDVYVGWSQGGDVLEIASLDPTLGPVFYTLRQEETARPTFERQTHSCLQCHDSPSLTGGVPGLIMRSVYTDGDGEPLGSAGTFVTTDQSPLKERWGGWYVTGTDNRLGHMGNVIAAPAPKGVHLAATGSAGMTDLQTRIDTRPYLSAHSDIVALMVLAHQIQMHNLITRASYRVRMAQSFDRVRNAELGRSSDHVPETTRSLVSRVAEPLVRAMLFVDEASLAAPVSVSGTSGFATEFADQGPRDRTGRSLLEFDLERRLFRYPCSYVIYSASFDALPSLMKEYVYRRLSEILNGEDRTGAFVHLTPEDRAAIRNILLDTKPDFAAWRAARAAQ